MAHIMLVDDERDVVTLLKFILEKEGHRITTANNGAEALEKLGLEPARESDDLPDVIILDVMMPIMDGYTVSCRLAQNAKMRGIPLIVLTAKGEMRNLFQSIKSVATYVDKPFDPKRLREIIAGVLAEKKK
ncbi:MAG: response regulator [Elusimicrobiota bacterium]|jgi:two-component system phosphate regulon response regulator PhoB